ncbi:bifunctional transcriptional activator/DNA repair enzyme AdaA [Candidatus Korobacter versatilis]|nr:methylated-DNA--[protein]-cysteine S-methyltransferase [Candidatus Koribacter versatilis]
MKPRTLKLEVNEMSTETMWEKVLQRDAAADGRFVYAVRSTHIYCRPTCPSKRPNREQVEFFANPKEAEQKGYRACRRCAPKTENIASHVARICRELTDDYKGLSPEDIAAREGLALRRLNQIFRTVLGVTVREYLASHKLEDFKSKLKTSQDVTGSMYDAGFGSPSRLYEKSDAVLGMTPASYGRGGRGAHIAFGIRDSEIGHILIAATEKGVCTISFGDNAKKLESDLRKEFHAAEITRNDDAVEQYLDAIAAHIEGNEFLTSIPIDIHATAFQAKVWQLLRNTKPGETLTYSGLAAKLGAPSASRAVARACASNRVAIAIPCHRVVAASGDLSGYRWGVERKRQLLQRERKQVV